MQVIFLFAFIDPLFDLQVNAVSQSIMRIVNFI